MKMGKTRSTQLMPEIVLSNRWVGGGFWIWYIQGGRTPKGIMAEKTIPKIEIPRNRSKER